MPNLAATAMDQANFPPSFKGLNSGRKYHSHSIVPGGLLV
jgi:hypothetical protein